MSNISKTSNWYSLSAKQMPTPADFNAVNEIKKEKEQKSTQEISHIYEQGEVAEEKKWFEETVTHTQDSQMLHNIIMIFSGNAARAQATFSVGNKQILNQVEWKNNILLKAIQNNTTQEYTLKDFWNLTIKPRLSSLFTVDAIGVHSYSFGRCAIEVLKKPMCPISAISDFFEFVSKTPSFLKLFRMEIQNILLNHPDLDEEILKRLPLKEVAALPLIHQTIAMMENAPVDMVVNWALQNEEDLKDVENPKALDVIVKITGTASKLHSDQVARMVKDQGTSQQSLVTILQTMKSFSSFLFPDVKIPSSPTEQQEFEKTPSDFLAFFKKETQASAEQYFDSVFDLIACHTNAPPDFAVQRIIEKDIDLDEVKNAKIKQSAKEVIYKNFEKKYEEEKVKKTEVNDENLEYRQKGMKFFNDDE